MGSLYMLNQYYSSGLLLRSGRVLGIGENVMLKKYADNPLAVYLTALIICLLLAGSFSWRDLGLAVVISGILHIMLTGILDNFVKP